MHSTNSTSAKLLPIIMMKFCGSLPLNCIEMPLITDLRSHCQAKMYVCVSVTPAAIPSIDKGHIVEILILWSHSTLTIFQIENYILASRKYAMTTAQTPILYHMAFGFVYSPGAS